MAEIDNEVIVPATPPTPNPAPQSEPSKPQGKVWTDEYVQGLREENKSRRIAAKTANDLLKTVLGLKDDEDVDPAKVTAYQARQQQQLADALAIANERLITAEIKSMNGYDPKLVARLLDRSKVTIDKDGNVTGIKEALVELEKEFPQIKTSTTAPGAGAAGGAANPANASGLTTRDQLIEQYNAAEKAGNVYLCQTLAAQIKSIPK